MVCNLFPSLQGFTLIPIPMSHHQLQVSSPTCTMWYQTQPESHNVSYYSLSLPESNLNSCFAEESKCVCRGVWPSAISASKGHGTSCTGGWLAGRADEEHICSETSCGNKLALSNWNSAALTWLGRAFMKTCTVPTEHSVPWLPFKHVLRVSEDWLDLQ